MCVANDQGRVGTGEGADGGDDEDDESDNEESADADSEVGNNRRNAMGCSSISSSELHGLLSCSCSIGSSHCCMSRRTARHKAKHTAARSGPSLDISDVKDARRAESRLAAVVAAVVLVLQQHKVGSWYSAVKVRLQQCEEPIEQEQDNSPYI